MLARKAQLSQDPIEIVYSKIPELNVRRAAYNLPPIVDLSVGQPHLGTHSYILEKQNEFLQLPNATYAFKYPPIQGSDKTLEAITLLYKAYYPAVNFSPKEVMITNGATQALYSALSILLDPGDQVLGFEPYYSAYPLQTRNLGGEFVKIPTAHNQFKPTATDLKAILSTHPKAKALIFNYPNNPTGIDLSKNELRDIFNVLLMYPELVVIIDDVYGSLTKNKHYTLFDIHPELNEDLKKRTIVINSASKEFALPGQRVGMIATNATWIPYLVNQQALITSGISTLTQQGLIAATSLRIEHAVEYSTWIEMYKEAYEKNRILISHELRNFGFKTIESENGLFVLSDASFLIDKDIPHFSNMGDDLHQLIGSTVFRHDNDIINYFLYAAGVALVPGSGFGIAPEMAYLRFSCAKTSLELKQALSQIKEAISIIPGMELDERKPLNNLFFSTQTKKITPALPQLDRSLNTCSLPEP